MEEYSRIVIEEYLEPIEKQRKVHSYGIWLISPIRWNANRKTVKEFSWSVT